MTDSQPFAVSADGTRIEFADYGAGKPIVILHGGMGAAAHWQATGDLLAPRWRIIAVERRVYGRSGLPKLPHSMAREAEDVRAVLERIGAPALLVGQSSGGIVTLEAALTHPPLLRGIVLYEPPVQLATPLGGDTQAQAEAALAQGDADEALRRFFRGMVELPPAIVEYMSRGPAFAAEWAEMVRLAPAQLEDNRAVRALPLGVERYRAIDVPALLLRGTESPPHLFERLDALEAIIPATQRATMDGENHTAHRTAPEKIAGIIEGFAQQMLS